MSEFYGCVSTINRVHVHYMLSSRAEVYARFYSNGAGSPRSPFQPYGSGILANTRLHRTLLDLPYSECTMATRNSPSTYLSTTTL